MMGAEALLPNGLGMGREAEGDKYFVNKEGISLIVTVRWWRGMMLSSMHKSKSIGCYRYRPSHARPTSDAFACVHPEHQMPFKYLAGCGVAFKLATALLETIPTEMLDSGHWYHCRYG